MKYRGQAGTSLVEVLVTALILAIGLLGLAALQSRSLQYNHASALRSQANVLASDIIDRMRINRVVAQANGYQTAFGQAQTGSGSLVEQDLSEWKGLLSAALPSGDGAVSCGVNNVCTVSVRWRERNASEDSENETPELSQFTYSTRL